MLYVTWALAVLLVCCLLVGVALVLRRYVLRRRRISAEQEHVAKVRSRVAEYIAATAKVLIAAPEGSMSGNIFGKDCIQKDLREPTGPQIQRAIVHAIKCSMPSDAALRVMSLSDFKDGLENATERKHTLHDVLRILEYTVELVPAGDGVLEYTGDLAALFAKYGRALGPSDVSTA